MYSHPKLAWPPAPYVVISRNHSNWPSLNLSQNACQQLLKTSGTDFLYSTKKKLIPPPPPPPSPLNNVRGLSYANRRRTNFSQEYSFLLFSKAFIALYVFINHQCNDFVFFYVFDGFLDNSDTFILAWAQHRPWRAIFSTILTERKNVSSMF